MFTTNAVYKKVGTFSCQLLLLTSFYSFRWQGKFLTFCLLIFKHDFIFVRIWCNTPNLSLGFGFDLDFLPWFGLFIHHSNIIMILLLYVLSLLC